MLLHVEKRGSLEGQSARMQLLLISTSVTSVHIYICLHTSMSEQAGVGINIALGTLDTTVNLLRQRYAFQIISGFRTGLSSKPDRQLPRAPLYKGTKI